MYPLPSSSVSKSVSHLPLESTQLLEGIYVDGAISSKGQIKAMWLKCEQGEFKVKIPKPIRHTLSGRLTPGMPLKVWARPKEDGFKALMVVPNFEIKASDNLTHSNQVNIDSETVSPVQSKKQPSTLKVCVKGSCCKKGSRKVLAALESAIDTNQLHDVVVVEPTGCLKNCKKGPAIKLSGSGKTYTGVSPSDVSKLLKHPTIAQK